VERPGLKPRPDALPGSRRGRRSEGREAGLAGELMPVSAGDFAEYSPVGTDAQRVRVRAPDGAGHTGWWPL